MGDGNYYSPLLKFAFLSQIRLLVLFSISNISSVIDFPCSSVPIYSLK